MSPKKKFLSDIPLTTTAPRFLQNDKNCSPDDITHRTIGILDHIATKFSKLTRKLVTVLVVVMTLVSETRTAIRLR